MNFLKFFKQELSPERYGLLYGNQDKTLEKIELFEHDLP